MNTLLFVGGILGLLSVMISAYADHSLSLYLEPHTLKSLLTAIKYHQIYAIVICVLALNHYNNWLSRAAWVFIAGTLMFSFSIYFSILFNIAKLTYFTPFGGILLMLGWCCIARAALFIKKPA